MTRKAVKVPAKSKPKDKAKAKTQVPDSAAHIQKLKALVSELQAEVKTLRGELQRHNP